MDKLEGSGRFKGACDLHHHFHRAIGHKPPGKRNRLPQISARNPIHHNVVETVLFIQARIVHCDEVWMADARGDFCLSQESLYICGICRRDFGIEHFEGEARLQEFVPREIHRPQASFAEKALYHIAAKLIADGENIAFVVFGAHFASFIFRMTAV